MPSFSIESDFSKFLEIIKSKNIKMIIFGETHGMLDDQKIQNKIISSVKSHYFLYELLEDKKILTPKDFKYFLDKNDNEDFSIISKYKDLKSTILLAQSKNISLIGCDIKNLGRKNTKFLKIKEINPTVKKFEEILLAKREKRQASVILKFLKDNHTLFVSVGDYHLRKESHLLNCLKKMKYLKVYPSLFGKAIFEPPSPENLKYVKWVFEESDENN